MNKLKNLRLLLAIEKKKDSKLKIERIEEITKRIFLEENPISDEK